MQRSNTLRALGPSFGVIPIRSDDSCRFVSMLSNHFASGSSRRARIACVTAEHRGSPALWQFPPTSEIRIPRLREEPGSRRASIALERKK